MKGLERTLGLKYVVAISIGAMLGSGIFVLPGLAAAKTGPSVWLAYLLAALCVLPAALSKAEMATAMPTSGGTYVYVDRAFGPLVGTISGIGLWASLLLKSAFALVGFGAYLSIVHDLPVKPMALSFLAIIVILNLLGVNGVARIMLYVVAAALAGLLALVFADVAVGEPVPPQRFFAEGAGGFLSATAFVFVAYAGVTKVAAIAEEVKQPHRNVPAGMLISLGMVAIAYAAVVMALVDLIPIAELSHDLRPIHTLAKALLGPQIAVGFAVLGVITMASMANAGLLAASRFPFAMSRDKLLPDSVSALLPSRRTPAVAILATAAAMACAIVFLDVEGMAKIASAFVIGIFSLVNLALIVLREGGAPWYRPTFRSPLYPIVQIAGVVAGLVLLGFMGGNVVLAFLGVVVPGTLVYVLYGRGRTQRRGTLHKMTARPDLLATSDFTAQQEEIDDAPEEAAVTVALFGWERSPEALVEVGGQLARGRLLEVAHLTELPVQTPVDALMDPALMPQVRSLRRRIRALAAVRKYNVHFDAVVSRDLVKRAHEISNRLHCRWLVMGWRSRRRHQRFLFVNPLGWLVNHLSCNLALFRDAGVRYVRKVVAYPEPGPDDALIARVANNVAQKYGADLTFARFVADDAPEDRVAVERAYVEQLAALCDVKTHARIVRGTDKVNSLAALTASYDLMVTAAPNVTSFWGQIGGTDQDRLTERSACSVLSVKSPPGRTHDDILSWGEGAEGNDEAFDLMDYVEPDCIRTRQDLSSRDTVFDSLSRVFAEAVPGLSQDEIGQSLWEREKTQSTAVGQGVAMPHASHSATKRAMVGLLTLSEPIEYPGPLEGTVDVVFSMLGPPQDRQTHLLILGTLARLVLREDFLARLRAARDADDVIEAFDLSLAELANEPASAS